MNVTTGTRTDATAINARATSYRRLRPVTRGILSAAGVATCTAMAGGVLPPLVAVAVLGVVCAGLAGAARLVWSRRTAACVAVMLAGYVTFLVSTSGAGTVFLARHLSLGGLEVAFGVVVTGLAAACAAPLAMATRDNAGGRTGVGRRDLVLAVTGVVTLTLAHTYGTSFVVLALSAACLPVLLAVPRIGAAVRGRRVSFAHLRSPLTHRPAAARSFALVVFFAMLAATVTTGAYDVLLPASPATGRAALLAACALGAVVAMLPARRAPIATTLMTVAAAAFLASQVVGVRHDPGEAVRLPSPVPGTWSVIHGGRAELVNQHRAALVQDDALDIVQIVDGATHRGDPTVLANYFVFGQPVTAPAAGRVAAAVGDLPDQRIGESDPRRPAGNHVVIDIGGGRYVALGHLRAGSLAVRLGEQVVAGQRIAEVGNSGNSSEPHLHMQVQNAPAFDVETPVAGARTFPWLVADVNVTRVWAGTTRPTSADLRRGDTFTAANPLTP